MTESKEIKKNDLRTNILIGLLFVVGIAVLLYPTVSDAWNRHRNSKLINQYDAILESLAPEDYSKLWEDAEEYNKRHVVNVFTDSFSDENYQLSHPYDQILNPGGNNIMGYIDVPKIGQKLAIGHGTGAYILERGVGHVEGTSLPIGGPNAHAVLAGHRGLPTAKIFSDLDQVVVGDKFFLYILDDILAYEIDQIEVVLPNDATFLQIEEGEDLVTLLTCTPYGVNSHRMLVRGHRIPYVPEDILEQRGQRQISERDKPILIALAGLIVLMFIVLGMKWYAAKKKREKEDEQKNAEIVAAKQTAIEAVQQAEIAVEAAQEAKQAAYQAQVSETKEDLEQAIQGAAKATKKAENARDHAKKKMKYLFEEDKNRKEDKQ